MFWAIGLVAIAGVGAKFIQAELNYRKKMSGLMDQWEKQRLANQ